MSDANEFAQETINQITPSNMRRFGYWLLTVTIIATACMTSILINQTQYQKDQVILQDTVMELSETVGKISDNYIRLDAEVKKNQEISDLRHPQ